jgi:methyltransferase (TIGR00027 family)
VANEREPQERDSGHLPPDVCDTARWAAAYRELESARPDALFADPLAARLAGVRGHQIVRSMSPGVNRNSAWTVVVRTRLIDDLVMQSIAGGADCVVNLAAGLDARPYRLPVPDGLRWIEADLPEIVDEKERILASEVPRCHLERARVDLADAGARGEFLDRALKGSKRAVVITEGLLIYLGAEGVRSLSGDLAARSAFQVWILDLVSHGLLQLIRRQVGERLDGSAQPRFGPKEGVAFFEPMGWRPAETRSLLQEAARFGRLSKLLRLLSFLPAPDPRRPGHIPWAAVARLERR